MKAIILLLLFLAGLFQCEGDQNPPCTDSLILQLKAEPVRNPPAEIWEYTIGVKRYYYTPSYCCDMFSDLYDQDCTLVCHPDGGITGNGDGACDGLKDQLKNGKLIWKDTRE